MIYRACQTIRRPRIAIMAWALVCIGTAASSSRAQMGGIDSDPGSPGTGGRNTIEGRLYYPSGRIVDKRLNVRMTSVRGGDFFTMSDDNGAFSFRRVSGGSYVVTVDAGSEYESVTEQVEVVGGSTARGMEMGRTYSLQIQLRPKAVRATPKAAVINAALAGVPKPAADLYQQALDSLQAGNRQKAVELLKQAIALYPEFPVALNQLGVVYHELGQSAKAEEVLRSAVKLAPNVFEFRLNLGVVLLKNKDYVGADKELQAAGQLDPTSTTPHLYRGKALIQLHQFPDAEKELQAVIKLGGNDVAMAYRFLGALYNERGQDQLAINALEKYLSLEPKARDAAAVRNIIKELQARVVSR